MKNALFFIVLLFSALCFSFADDDHQERKILVIGAGGGCVPAPDGNGIYTGSSFLPVGGVIVTNDTDLTVSGSGAITLSSCVNSCNTETMSFTNTVTTCCAGIAQMDFKNKSNQAGANMCIINQASFGSSNSMSIKNINTNVPCAGALMTMDIVNLSLGNKGGILNLKNTGGSNCADSILTISSDSIDTGGSVINFTNGHTGACRSTGEFSIIDRSVSGPIGCASYTGDLNITKDGDAVSELNITNTLGAVNITGACSNNVFIEGSAYVPVISGAGAPTSAPTGLGQIYIDTTADIAYIGTDIFIPANFKQVTN